MEGSVIPGGGIAVAPTASIGIGSRVFLNERHALRLELRNDLLIEHRSITDTTHFKQNSNVTVGYTWFSPKPVRQ